MLSVVLMSVFHLTLMSALIRLIFQRLLTLKMLPILFVPTSSLYMVSSVSCLVVHNPVLVVKPSPPSPQVKKPTLIKPSLIPMLVLASHPTPSLTNLPLLPSLISMTLYYIWVVPAHNLLNAFVNTPPVLLLVFSLSNLISTSIIKWSSSTFVTSKMNFVQLQCILS